MTPSPQFTPLTIKWPGSATGYSRPAVLGVFDCPWPNGSTVSGGLVYTFCGAKEVRAFDLKTTRLVRTFPLNLPDWLEPECSGGGACTGRDVAGTVVVDHGLWVGWGAGGVQRLNLTTGKVIMDRPHARLRAYGLGALWLVAPNPSASGSESLAGYSPANGQIIMEGASMTDPPDDRYSIGCGLVWSHVLVLRSDARVAISVAYGERLPWGQELGGGSSWSASIDEDVEGVVQIGSDCWVETKMGDRRTSRLGHLSALWDDPSGVNRWSDALPGDVMILGGVPWLVRSDQSGSTMQPIDMNTLRPTGDIWELPGDGVFQAGDSIWCVVANGAGTVLVRLAMPRASVPSPTPSPVSTPTSVATSSPTPDPTPAAETPGPPTETS